MAWYDATAPAWLGADWKDDVTQWVDAVLADGGHVRTSELEPVHLRVWSAVCRARTSAGEVYFKSTPPPIDFEPALLNFLCDRGFEGLRLVGVDLERNWMLTAGEGQTVRQRFGATPEGLARWRELLTRYGQMQLALAPHADALVAAGVPDLRLAELPAQFDLLAAWAHLGCGDDGLTEAERRRFSTLRPNVQALCEQVDALGIPQTLQHNDLHDSNVFVRDDRFVIFDWGDASVAHPFFDGEVLFAVAKGRFGLEPGVDGFEEFQNAFLAPFADRVGLEKARQALALAVPLGKLCRAMTWHRIVEMPGGEGAREIVARRAKQLLGLLAPDADVKVGPSAYL